MVSIENGIAEVDNSSGTAVYNAGQEQPLYSRFLELVVVSQASLVRLRSLLICTEDQLIGRHRHPKLVSPSLISCQRYEIIGAWRVGDIR